MNEIRIGYMCAVDFRFHLENDSQPQRVYPDIETLIEKRKCVTSCGAVKVEMKVLEELDLSQIQDYSSTSS